jgi:superfamily II DNA or RNA helicase
MSATPFTHGGTDKVQMYRTKGWFGSAFKVKTTEEGKLTTKELQKRGILSKAKCTFYPVYEPEIKYAPYQEATTQGIAENEIFHKQVIKLTKELKGRTLIIVDRIAHGDRLNELIPDSIWVKGEDNIKTRQQVIETLQKSKDNVIAIATSGIFNTGINVFVHNLLNCSGGKSEHVMIQRFGRGLRTADDKEQLNYIDFVFHNNTDYLLKHSKKRIEIFKKEGHIVEVIS